MVLKHLVTFIIQTTPLSLNFNSLNLIKLMSWLTNNFLDILKEQNIDRMWFSQGKVSV